jgi:disulfide bond formation protein DsbB
VFYASAIFGIAAATIGGAWIFEALGYAPCELCLAQRWPYYVAVPLAGVTLVLAGRRKGWADTFASAGFAVVALVFVASALFGAYHAGVEWGFWPGPKACAGHLVRAESAEAFLDQLNSEKVVRCDAPALRILGLSLAGWNAILSLGLAGLAGRAAWKSIQLEKV